MPLADRVVLITGATGMLGSVATHAFLQAGARVAAMGTALERLTSLAASWDAPEQRWAAITGDLRSPDAAAAAVAAATERFGRIDVLLHLVGGWAGGTAVVDLDANEMRAMLDQHLWTTLNVVKAVTPGMLERRWGRILAVSSPLAQTPGPKGASYAVAKAAQEILIRSLARETGGQGVTANLVSVRTIGRPAPDAPSSRTASWTTPEEISEVLLFLASDDSASVNGTVIPLYNRT